jgi:biopolymer transport protein ExbB
MPIDENYFDEYILQGGLTMLALVPLSVITLGVIVQRLLDLRQSKIIPKKLLMDIETISSKEEFDQFHQNLNPSSSSLAKIVSDYIEAGQRGESLHPDVNPFPIEDEMDKLYQSLSPLSTAYIIAPLLGVLGTTIGIMGTFEQFSVVGKRDMTALVSAIDKSLITTMWGLIIAVPAYYFYAILQNKIYQYERNVLPRLLKRIMKNFSYYID